MDTEKRSQNESEDLVENYLEGLKTILDWVVDGPGQDNFIRIVAESGYAEVQRLATEKGYACHEFKDPNDQDGLKELEKLVINAQTYMNGKQGRVLIFVTPSVEDALKANDFSRGTWHLNGMYMTTVRQNS